MMVRAIWLVSLIVIVGCKGAPSSGAGAGASTGPKVSAEPTAAAAGAPQEKERQGPDTRVVRLSKGAFPAEKYEQVKARLDAAKETLVPAIRALRGCLHYWVAIDPVTNTMINVSLWETLEDAKQMEMLEPMRALAGEFIGLGVTFERPITNSLMLWEVPLGAK